MLWPGVPGLMAVTTSISSSVKVSRWDITNIHKREAGASLFKLHMSDSSHRVRSLSLFCLLLPSFLPLLGLLTSPLALVPQPVPALHSTHAGVLDMTLDLVTEIGRAHV